MGPRARERGVRPIFAETDIYAIPGFAEPFSCFTHLLGAGIFLVLGFFLVRRGRGSRARRFSLFVFAFACVHQLALSGVYHLLSTGGAGRAVLQRLDHAAIFVLIAGTFTAAHTILFTGIARWGMLLLIWAAAITGLTLKTIFFDSVPEALGLSLYVGLGWVGLGSAVMLWRRYGFTFIKPMLWGAVFYTAGGVLEFLREPTLIPGVIGPHELFHIAVLAGLSFHWRFTHSFADGSLPPTASH